MSNEITITTHDNDNSFLSPKNFEHAFRMANMISKSAMVPKAYANKPQDVLIAMEMGRSLRLSPLAAVQNIAVINGKPALYGDGMLAVCSGHPDFEDIKEHKILDQDKKTIGYECIVKRRGRTEVSNLFTIQDAVTANLWGKAGPWTSYPSRMLQMRARGFALRDSFADALGGVRMAEEVQDYDLKDITPKDKNNGIKEDLKALVEKNKAAVEEPLSETREDDTPVLTAMTIDELTVVKEFLIENNISNQRRDEVLKNFNVTHVEKLASEQVDDFVAQLIG